MKFKDCEEFYNYLKSKFSNLKECIQWYQKWKDNDQVIPEYEKEEFSLRTMAYHCSRVLEGYAIDPYLNRITSYINTKYGVEIYFS